MEKASIIETLNGHIDDKAVTPRSLAKWGGGVQEQLNSFEKKLNSPSLKGESGYTDLPNGMILQWGRTTGTGYKNFPKPFPNGCLFVTSSGVWASGSNPAYLTMSGIDSWDKNGFTVGSFGYFHTGGYGEAISTQSYRSINPVPNFAGPTRWFAVGY